MVTFWKEARYHLHTDCFLIQSVLCSVSWVIVTNDCPSKSIFPSFEEGEKMKENDYGTSRHNVKNAEEENAALSLFGRLLTIAKGVQIGRGTRGERGRLVL